MRVLRWHDSRVTLRQLSKELGVSTSTITAIIKSRGTHYKQAPPEERAAALTAHRERCAKLRDANFL
jgi:IS30 family transposase